MTSYDDAMDYALDENRLELFTAQRMEDGEADFLLMGFSEDELVLMHGLTKHLIDMSELMGTTPSVEMASVCSRFTEGLLQFYDEGTDE